MQPEHKSEEVRPASKDSKSSPDSLGHKTDDSGAAELSHSTDVKLDAGDEGYSEFATIITEV